MAEINGQRLLEDLRTLAGFGSYRTGVDRVAFSPPDVEARQWLASRLNEAGLAASLDRFGTVYGRAPDASRAVLVGSHTDTVPKGGWLDGALGVIYGLEIARSLREQGRGPAVDVVSFQDEEGTYVPCLGSKAFCGLLDEEEVRRAEGPGGRKLSQAMAESGFERAPLTLERERVIAFLETHIEQGPRLEAVGARVGVVTGIVGIRRYRVTADGQSDHAGTTPMHMRKDAGAALIRIANAVLEAFPGQGAEETVWNIGFIRFEPGSANVVPQSADMIVEIRDLQPEVLDRLEGQLGRIAAEIASGAPVSVGVQPIGRVEPVSMDGALCETLSQAAAQAGIKALTMPSGAGHDAMILTQVVPSALMFVPSIGGRSHDVAEDTREEDIVAGCRVMATAVAALEGH